MIKGSIDDGDVINAKYERLKLILKAEMRTNKSRQSLTNIRLKLVTRMIRREFLTLDD